MRIAVYGAGGVGGYVGDRPARAGAGVRFIASCAWPGQGGAVKR